MESPEGTSVLPDSAMLEVDYEDLDGELEAGTKRVLNYCCLRWDARCLNFQETKRAIDTVSVY